MIRCLGHRAALVSSGRAPRRAFGSSRASLVGVVDKTVIPPKASIPPPVKEVVLKPTAKVVHKSPPNNVKKSAFNNNKKAPPVKQQQEHQPKSLSGLPTSGWVIIRNIPPMSSLTDIVQSINEAMDIQAETGIVDLDAVWKGGGQVRMLELDSSSQDWVRSAHLVLSSHGRPTGWRIEFHNRSMAHAFLEYCRRNRFHCAWKPVSVEQWKQRGTAPPNVSDSMIRVENAGDDLTVDHVRHLFRRYDMATTGPTVKIFNENSLHKVFVVHFADPSWARAAIRELQGVQVHERCLRLAHYPRQLI